MTLIFYSISPAAYKGMKKKYFFINSKDIFSRGGWGFPYCILKNITLSNSFLRFSFLLVTYIYACRIQQRKLEHCHFFFGLKGLLSVYNGCMSIVSGKVRKLIST